MKNVGVIIFLLFSITLVSQNSFDSECGVSSSGEINYANGPGKAPRDVRLMLWVTKESDGTGGTDVAEVVQTAELIKETFASPEIGINIHYCVRELHNSAYVSLEKRNKIMFDHPCYQDYLQVTIYEFNGLAGEAVLEGRLAHSTSAFGTLAHEIGHVFGLYHTFHNCGNSDSDKVYAKDCVTGIRNCHLTGDKICDTPANITSVECDKSFYFEQSTCKFSNPLGVIDECGDEYQDTKSVLVKNFMSYENGTCKSSFTPEQVGIMCNTILGKSYSGTLENEECLTEPILVFSERYKEDILIGSGTYENHSKVVVDGCTVTLSDATVNMNYDISLINGGVLILNNSKLIRDSSDDCIVEGDGFNSIFSISPSTSVIAYNQSEIEAEVPIRGLFDLVYLNNSKISGDIQSILVENTDLYINSQSTIFGGVKALGTTTKPKFEARYSEFFSGLESDYNDIGIENNGLQSSWIKRCKVKESHVSYKSNDSDFSVISSCELESSNINSANDPGVDISLNHLEVVLDDSHIKNRSNRFTNNSSLQLSNNNFSASNDNFLITIDAINESESRVEGNEIKNNQKGIESKGSQTGMKFLCNSFDEVNIQNFYWEEVAIGQGYDFDVASGNQFSDCQDNIGGNSLDGTLYNYLLLTNEIPDVITNNGVTENLVFRPAQCGIIGPKWIPTLDGPPIIIDELEPDPHKCPWGINCNIACPPGIDCKENCPPGVDCTQACPLGIDCTQPCPPGIDCTLPCPPGIDCTQPCPPGIDCTLPCPPNLICSIPCPKCPRPCKKCPDGNPVNDPVIPRIESELQELEAQQSALRGKRNKDEVDYVLDEKLADPDRQNKLEIFQRISENPQMLNTRRLQLVFDNSLSYSEHEVVDLIKMNPLVLIDPNVNRIVFNSNNFSDPSKEELSTAFSKVNKSERGENFYELIRIEERKQTLILYVVSRLARTDGSYLQEEIKWMQRIGELQAELAIVELLLAHNQDEEALDYIDNILEEWLLDFSAINDINAYKNIISLILNARIEGRNLSTLNSQEKDVLISIAYAANRYSTDKARGILSTYYGMEFGEANYSGKDVKTLNFMDQDNMAISSRNKETVYEIYPNPSIGNLVLNNASSESLLFKLSGVSGKILNTVEVNSHSRKEISSPIKSGVLLIRVQNEAGGAKGIQKVLILE